MSCCTHSTEAFSANTNGASTGATSTTDAATSVTPTANPSSANKNRPPRSFYRRQLPDSCTALSSEEGQARFASALANQGLKSFFSLIEQFTTQSEPAFCGISTLVIVLNALAMDPRQSWKGPWRWYEETMLNCGLNLEEVKTTGITMSEFRCLAICQGLTTTMERVDEEKEEAIALQKFRHAVERACIKSDADNSINNPKDELLVVSYSRKILGQTGSGHFSPIAAYDSASDSVLVLDTARFKYGAHWVSLPLLFQAMMPVDPDTGRSRGYILLSDHDQHHHPKEDSSTTSSSSSSPMMPSLLFRSQRKQNPIRREYKDFLVATTDTDNLTFDQVAAFWTTQGPKYIWQMMEPQFTPLPGDESTTLIASVRALIQSLLKRVKKQSLPEECCGCRVNFQRTLDLSPEEAIFVVYLASLEEDARKAIVMMETSEEDTSTGLLTPTQTQLLTEAELVRYAIDMSDDAGGALDCESEPQRN